VLANFICDACSGDEIASPAHREITEHVELLQQFSQAHPDSSIVISPPLPRTVPDWYPAYLPGFSAFLYQEVVRMDNPRLKFMSPFVAPPSFFESDGVHLNADAGASFINYLVSSADLLFPDLPALPDPNPTGVTEISGLARLALTVSALREDVDRRRRQDNLVFARIKEDRDHEINRSREDRCTLSGLKVFSAPPADAKARKEFFKQLITTLVAEACPRAENPPIVIDVLVNMRPGRGPPYFEVKFDSVASSTMFRMAAAKLAKDEVGSFQGVFVSNTVNQSTRIRIDIMKLIAKHLTTATELSYVQGFSSRPTLHYHVKECNPSGPPSTAIGTGRSYTFTESVERWGHLLTPQSLAAVRRKASQAFHGCLEQYFVVLSDHPPPEASDDLFTRLLPVRPPGRSHRGGRPFSFRRGTRGTHQARSTRSAPSVALTLPVAGSKRAADPVDSDTEAPAGTPSKKK